MTTKVQANIRVNEILFFHQKNNTAAKAVIKGYSIGPDSFYNTVEVWGKEAERMNRFLKRNSLIDVKGSLLNKKVIREGKPDFYVTYIKPDSIIFISGVKSEIERLDLKPITEFVTLTELQSYVASIVNPLGFHLPPVATTFDFLINRIGMSEKADELVHVLQWLHDLNADIHLLKKSAQ